MRKRIDFDKMMLIICELVSRRSHCLKGRVGCVIVLDGRIISMGYNGMLPKFKHCKTADDCPRMNIPGGTQYEIGDCQHAEQNAILFCSKHGVPTEGAVLYVNSAVCRICARAIIMAGITKVVYLDSEYDGVDLLRKGGIECTMYKSDELVESISDLAADYGLEGL